MSTSTQYDPQSEEWRRSVHFNRKKSQSMSSVPTAREERSSPPGASNAAFQSSSSGKFRSENLEAEIMALREEEKRLREEQEAAYKKVRDSIEAREVFIPVQWPQSPSRNPVPSSTRPSSIVDTDGWDEMEGEEEEGCRGGTYRPPLKETECRSSRVWSAQPPLNWQANTAAECKKRFRKASRGARESFHCQDFEPDLDSSEIVCPLAMSENSEYEQRPGSISHQRAPGSMYESSHRSFFEGDSEPVPGEGPQRRSYPQEIQEEAASRRYRDQSLNKRTFIPEFVIPREICKPRFLPTKHSDQCLNGRTPSTRTSTSRENCQERYSAPKCQDQRLDEKTPTPRISTSEDTCRRITGLTSQDERRDEEIRYTIFRETCQARISCIESLEQLLDRRTATKGIASSGDDYQQAKKSQFESREQLLDDRSPNLRIPTPQELSQEKRSSDNVFQDQLYHRSIKTPRNTTLRDSLETERASPVTPQDPWTIEKTSVPRTPTSTVAQQETLTSSRATSSQTPPDSFHKNLIGKPSQSPADVQSAVSIQILGPNDDAHDSDNDIETPQRCENNVISGEEPGAYASPPAAEQNHAESEQPPQQGINTTSLQPNVDQGPATSRHMYSAHQLPPERHSATREASRPPADGNIYQREDSSIPPVLQQQASDFNIRSAQSFAQPGFSFQEFVNPEASPSNYPSALRINIYQTGRFSTAYEQQQQASEFNRRFAQSSPPPGSSFQVFANPEASSSISPSPSRVNIYQTGRSSTAPQQASEFNSKFSQSFAPHRFSFQEFAYPEASSSNSPSPSRVSSPFGTGRPSTPYEIPEYAPELDPYEHVQSYAREAEPSEGQIPEAPSNVASRIFPSAIGFQSASETVQRELEIKTNQARRLESYGKTRELEGYILELLSKTNAESEALEVRVERERDRGELLSEQELELAACEEIVRGKSSNLDPRSGLTPAFSMPRRLSQKYTKKERARRKSKAQEALSGVAGSTRHALSVASCEFCNPPDDVKTRDSKMANARKLLEQTSVSDDELHDLIERNKAEAMRLAARTQQEIARSEAGEGSVQLLAVEDSRQPTSPSGSESEPSASGTAFAGGFGFARALPQRTGPIGVDPNDCFANPSLCGNGGSRSTVRDSQSPETRHSRRPS